MKEVLDFLNELAENNNRNWFQNNKNRYLKVQNKINDFALQLIQGISEFDDSIKNIGVKDATYRIYRDIRFSHDKRPYKTHIGIFVCPRGKKSGLSGYYFHVESDYSDFLSRSGLFVGLYNPESWMMQSIREDIVSDGETFHNSVLAAANFTLDTSQKYVKIPKGFSENDKYADYIRLKSLSLWEPADKDILFSDSLLDWVLKEFKTTYSFNTFINRAILFAMENGEY